MDITPAIPEGKNIIKGYGNMTFKINDDEHKNSIIVFPDKVISWDILSFAEVSVESLKDVLHVTELEILLLGCGDTHMPLGNEITTEFQKKNIGLEIMTTGAACRTYNVLLAEGRNVAAALTLV